MDLKSGLLKVLLSGRSRKSGALFQLVHFPIFDCGQAVLKMALPPPPTHRGQFFFCYSLVHAASFLLPDACLFIYAIVL